jgi:predicted protein tyrosine phosphatase
VEITAWSIRAMAAFHCAAHDGIISLRATGEAPLEVAGAPGVVLRLQVDDVELGEPGAMTPAIASRIVECIQTHPDITAWHVHCTMGASRSPGVVIGLLEGLGAPPADRRLALARWPMFHRGIAAMVREVAREKMSAPVP